MSVRTPISSEDLKRRQEDIEPLTKGFDVLSDHVVVTDTSGNILYANQAAVDRTGYSLGEMLGKNPGDLWGGNMPKKVYEDMWNRITILKKSWHGKVKNTRKDGTEYWVWLRVSPILNDAKRCLYYVAIEPNLTTAKLSKGELRTALAAELVLYDFYAGNKLTVAALSQMIDELLLKLGES